MKNLELFKIKTPRVLCDRSSALAEVVGIMLGDGCLYEKPFTSHYQIHIAGHLTQDKEYLLNYVRPLFERVFNLKMCVKVDNTNNCLYVWKQSKDLAHTLKFYGFPSGNKKNNNVQIPLWILNNKEYLRNCFRGIVDTDGSVYRKNNTHKHPTIWISSAIPNLRRSIEYSCQAFGLNLSKWDVSRNSAFITRKNDVLKYYSQIGFNNPKHRERWNLFMQAPVV